MSTPTFTDAEYGSLSHHLRVAAERYDEHAKMLRTPGVNGHTHESMAEQFERQAAQAREFADRVDEIV